MIGATTGIEWTDSTWSPIRVRVRRDAAQIARVKGYPGAEAMAGRVGKNSAGSLLDGVAYKDFPEVRMKPGVPAA